MARPKKQVAAASIEVGYAQNWNVTQGGLTAFPQLSGRKLLEEMSVMAATDETVGSMLWCISSTMGQITWKHEPQFSGQKAVGDKEAQRWADFADSVLIDMSHSYGDYVDDAMEMVWAGFSLSEMVTKQRTTGNSKFNDGFYGFERLSFREPLSIWGWNYSPDRRNVLSANQVSYQGTAQLPMWKLLHCRPTMSPDQPVGRSLLRAAHRAWRLKNRIQDSEAIGIERELAGLPIARVPQEDLATSNEVDGSGAPTGEAKAARARIQVMISAVTNMRFNKSGGLVMPSDTWGSENDTQDRTPRYDMKILTAAGQRSIDARTAARDYDRAIARVAMMQFLHLGDRSSGSYGLSDDQSSMAIRSMVTLASKVAEEWTRKGLGLLWHINGFPDQYLPALKPSPISKEGIQQIGAFMSGLARAEALWSTDTKARVAILSAAGLDYDVDAQEKASKKSAEAPVVAPAAKPPAKDTGSENP